MSSELNLSLRPASSCMHRSTTGGLDAAGRNTHQLHLRYSEEVVGHDASDGRPPHPSHKRTPTPYKSLRTTVEDDDEEPSS